jgi:hypothetical protein
MKKAKEAKRIEPRRHRGHGGYYVFPGRETTAREKAIACGEGLFLPDLGVVSGSKIE